MTLFVPRKTCLHIVSAVLMALGCASLLASPSCAQGVAQDPPGRVGRIALVDGTVSYHTADQNYWQVARRNYPVTTGQSFWTEPNAHAGIDVATDRIYLDSSTELDVSALDDATAQFSLPEGAVFLALRSLDRGKPYEIQMARAAVTLATAGRYELIAGDTEHASQVIVLDGSAHVSGNGFDLDVRAGETAVLSGEQTIRAEVRAAGPADAFVAWVEAQEKLRRRSAPAVASAMTGTAELGAYGRWARAAGYGDIWYPDVPAAWAPYRDGYWGWVEPWGWTWIDEEAWGFAPFHYGRWLTIDDRWAWIPGYGPADEPIAAIYAPALVTFFTAADTCAWVPLGPGETYVPAYPVSLGYFHSINTPYVRNIRTRQTIAAERARLNEFVNARAVIAVPASVVSRSQPVASHARAVSAARLADARPVIGALPVRPAATTAGLSPSVARRFGIASSAFAAAHAQTHAPGPPIPAVAPTANARLAAPRALPHAAQQTPPTAPQPLAHAPALVQPGATHHLPGSPVGEPGAGAGNRGTQAAPPSTTAARPAPPAVARTPEAPAGHPVPSPETAGRAVPRAAPSRPAPPPPVVVHRAATLPTVAHRPSPPAVHAAPPPVTVGRAPPPHAAIAAPPRPAAPPRLATPPVMHAPPPAAHAVPPVTVGRAPPPPAVHAPPPAAAPGRRQPGH